MRKFAPLLACAFLSGCARNIRLEARPQVSSRANLPFSASIELEEAPSAMSSTTPINFDLKEPVQGYFLTRGTFRDVTAAGGETVLRIRSRFILSSAGVFNYTFVFQSELRAAGKVLGRYNSEGTANGGATRVTGGADRVPMNEALQKVLDTLAGQIEDDAPTILAKRSGSELPAAPQAAPMPVPAAPPPAASSVDRPKYRLPENERDFALVIGVEKYDSLPPADFAERDAAAVREHLIALGVPPRNLIHLAGPKASRTGMEKYLDSWLPMNVKEGDRLFVFFSGHGAPDPQTGDAYLMPWDGDAKFLKNSGYPLKRFYAQLNALKAKQVVVVMDACFTGEGGRSVLAKGARPLVAKVDLEAGPGERLAVLAAAGGDEITASKEGEGHGLFTYHLLKGLEERGGKASLRELFDYLKPRVEDDASRDGRRQTPQLMAPDAGWLKTPLR